MTGRNVVIVGGGVAGLQAAILTAKAGEDTVVIDTDGSWVANTNDVRNLLGFDAVAGSTLIERGRSQLAAFGGERLEAAVERVERTDDGFAITTDAGSVDAEYVILASAGTHEYFEGLDLEYVDGVEGQYYMERHVRTDERNRAVAGVYAAGLTRTWEFQTAVAIGDGARAAVNLLSEKYGEPYMDHDV